VDYLLAFDVKYRIRRLQFLIEGQNRLYQLIGQRRFAPFVLSFWIDLSANFMTGSARFDVVRSPVSIAKRPAVWPHVSCQAFLRQAK
jgi:hypothetical protein